MTGLEGETEEPIDLRKRRLAREMQSEIGGLFGIDVRDIESAIDRLWERMDRGYYEEFYGRSQLPYYLERGIQCMEFLYELASSDDDDVEDASVRRARILELIDHYRERIERIGGSPDA